MGYLERGLIPHQTFKPSTCGPSILEQISRCQPKIPCPFDWAKRPQGCLRRYDGWYRLDAFHLDKAKDVIESIIASVRATRGIDAPWSSYMMATAIAAQVYPHLNDGNSEFGNVNYFCNAIFHNLILIFFVHFRKRCTMLS